MRAGTALSDRLLYSMQNENESFAGIGNYRSGQRIVSSEIECSYDAHFFTVATWVSIIGNWRLAIRSII